MVNGENVRSSLEVGFAGELPERYLRYRGRVNRSIPLLAEFPFEDSQFEVVIMDASAVSLASAREAHRVLLPDGRLFFTVPEKTGKQTGYGLPEIYSIVRDGFNIVKAERPRWWFFGRGERTLSICAVKKRVWKSQRGLFRNGATVVSPFHNRK